MILQFLCIIIALVSFTHTGHNCIHKNIYKKYVDHEKELDYDIVVTPHQEGTRRRRSQELEQYKIKIYTNFQNEYVSELLLEVVTELSTMIANKPPKRRINKVYTCGLWAFEGKDVQSEDYDLYIFASYNNLDCETGTIAYASPCKTFSDGKPITGMINLCPSNFDTNTLSRDELKLVIIHELFHVLIMSPTMIDDNNNIELDYFFEKNSVVKKMYSKEILAYGKRYFNCSSFDGIEIDPESFHFQNVLYYDDLMTPFFKRNGVSMLTKLDLVLLQSTGWYEVVDWETFGEVSFWGLGGTCDFTKLSCKYFYKKNKEDHSPFCLDGFGDESREVCSGTRKGVGACERLKRYTLKDVPRRFRYFKDASLGGSEHNKFCPIVEEINTFCSSSESCMDGLCRPVKCGGGDGDKFLYKKNGKWVHKKKFDVYCKLNNDIENVLLEVDDDEFEQDVLKTSFSISKHAKNVVNFFRKWFPYLFSLQGVIYKIPFELIGYRVFIRGLILPFTNFCKNFIVKSFFRVFYVSSKVVITDVNKFQK